MSACQITKRFCFTEDRARAYIFRLLDEAIVDQEGQRVLNGKVQLLPEALLQVCLTGVVQLALSQRHSCELKILAHLGLLLECARPLACLPNVVSTSLTLQARRVVNCRV